MLQKFYLRSYFEKLTSQSISFEIRSINSRKLNFFQVHNQLLPIFQKPLKLFDEPNEKVTANYRIRSPSPGTAEGRKIWGSNQ